MANDQDAQHQASPIRLQQAYQQGDFPRSFELAASIQLLGGTIACYFFAKTSAQQFVTFTSRIWNESGAAFSNTDQINELFRQSASEFVLMLLPLLGMIFLIGLMSHALQNTTFTFFNKPLFETRNLNPANNFQRVFSLNNLTRAILSIPKTALVMVASGLMIWHSTTMLANLPYQPTDQMLMQLLDSVFAVLITATTTMAVLAIFDYLIERFSFAQRNRMTDAQLREENRLQNVDPQIQNQRNQRYQEFFR